MRTKQLISAHVNSLCRRANNDKESANKLLRVSYGLSCDMHPTHTQQILQNTSIREQTGLVHRCSARVHQRRGIKTSLISRSLEGYTVDPQRALHIILQWLELLPLKHFENMFKDGYTILVFTLVSPGLTACNVVESQLYTFITGCKQCCRPHSLMLCLFNLEWTHKKDYLDFVSNSLIYYCFIAEHTVFVLVKTVNVDLSTGS